ncbi:MAG: bifunctional oligoribonuclease/PAP phosphatase NrnA [Flavobacteriaceae bacterium]|nr:bifunctional oligoribonuclease/PAP phosphatase NrnA [Bacteroidia bacterium]NNL16386.1 bifunctional oligoribonuclease/PAP phosphatase NrnA [Flavobacteriaceae bacterium]
MDKKDIDKVKLLLSLPKKIVIVSHKNPDGDAIGSSLGLYHFLIKLNHDVSVIMPNDYPDFLKWMPGQDIIKNYENNKSLAEVSIEEADLIFTLDFNSLERAGEMESCLKQSKATKIMIDHHQQPSDYAAYMYSDVSISSTCQMVYHFIHMLGKVQLIDKHIGTCLYTGIMTDTGSFRFSSTTSTTHKVVANLIEKGVDNSEIHRNVYDTNSFNRLQLLGKALNNLKVIPELKTAYITLSQKELNKFKFRKGDTEGVVNYGLSLKNVVFAAIFIEHKHEGVVKISFRSNGDFSVNEFARTHFSGGGHTNAAGGRSNLSLQQTVEKFISILPDYKKDLNK